MRRQGAINHGKDQMKRMIATDPYFLNEIGHHHAYHSAVQNSFERLGYRVETIIPIVCQVPSLDSVRWIRFFHHSENRIIRAVWHLFDYLRLFRRMRSGQFEKTVLFLESYSLLDMFSLILGVFLFGKKTLEIWQVFRDGLEWIPWKKFVYGWLTKIFRWRLKDRYHAFSDSEVAVESLTPHLGCSVVLLPIPHAPSKIGVQNFSSRKRKIRLWAAGQPRLDKGILEIKRFCSMPDPNLKNMELLLESNRFMDCSHSTNLAIRWIPSRLSGEEYLRTLMEADALLSPYDPFLKKNTRSRSTEL